MHSMMGETDTEYRFGPGWHPIRGRCFHPTEEMDAQGRNICCPRTATVRGEFVSPLGAGYVVDACPEHADILRLTRPLR
jgi:hypothetical protein